ncbi:MAG: autotransporter outer membrane beta-barrel domain-containing protein [Syntrophobacterales bacterium]|nr:autotransporter outer membrane beta-barrel domain-containing protein [Syntrophobacterales bacterium]
MKRRSRSMSRAALPIVLAAVLLYPFASATVSSAQAQDIVKIVRFQDGTTVTGRILEMNIHTIRIQAADGSVVTRKFDDIITIRNREDPAKPQPILPVHSVEIGFEAFHKEYKEPDVMNEKGMMLGVGLAYVYHDRVMFKASLLLAYGEVDYENSGTLDGIPDRHAELRGLVGYDIAVDPTFVVTPYIGLGYRFLRNDSAGMITSTGARGYNRESNYFYTPVGIALIKILPEGWTLSAEAEFDYLWYGKQYSDLSDANPLFPDISNDQDQGYGIRGAVRIEKKLTASSVFLEPFVRYWHVGQSDDTIFSAGGTLYRGYEPKNETTEIGARLGLKF